MRSAATIIGVLALTALRSFSIETIQIPNGSFETPTTTYASPFLDFWQKTAKPDWYDETGGFLWTQLTGEFTNTPPGAADHIDNCDGGQAAWMFVVPEVGIFQDYDYPTNHAFNATYEIGKSYHLTVGLIGGAQVLQAPGATFELALYYRDSASNMIVVAVTTVTNLSTVFSNKTHLIDFHADSGFVNAGAPWAGQHIGVRMLSSITDTNLEGGYWDLDNVRLTSTRAPALSNPVWTNGQFSCIIQSEPGMTLEIQRTTNLGEQNWSSAGFITNDTGTFSFTDTNATSGLYYYRARLVP
jgi:thiamine pyrophosphokinase